MNETVRQMLVVTGMAALFFGTCLERESFVDDGSAEMANLLQDQSVEARLRAVGTEDGRGVAHLDGTPDDLLVEAEAVGLEAGTYRLWVLGPGDCDAAEELAAETPLRISDPAEGEALVPTWTVLPGPADQEVPALFSGRGEVQDAESQKDLLALVGARVVIDRSDPDGPSVRGEPVLCGEIRTTPRTQTRRASM